MVKNVGWVTRGSRSLLVTWPIPNCN